MVMESKVLESLKMKFIVQMYEMQHYLCTIKDLFVMRFVKAFKIFLKTILTFENRNIQCIQHEIIKLMNFTCIS